jgi:HAE1 family hydrophobic/amphiphilic exporter-1
MKRPEIAVAFTSFKTDYPQLEMEVDDVKAEQLGVNVRHFANNANVFW